LIFVAPDGLSGNLRMKMRIEVRTLIAISGGADGNLTAFARKAW